MLLFITICAFRPSHILHVYIMRNFSKLLFFFPLLGVITFGFGISVLSKPSAILSRLLPVNNFTPVCFASGSCNAMHTSVDRKMNIKREIINEVPIRKYTITITGDDRRGLRSKRNGNVHKFVCSRCYPGQHHDICRWPRSIFACLPGREACLMHVLVSFIVRGFELVGDKWRLHRCKYSTVMPEFVHIICPSCGVLFVLVRTFVRLYVFVFVVCASVLPFHLLEFIFSRIT